MELKFEWDEEKDRINRQKHGISFETASYVFRDEYYIEMYDFEHSMEEDRYITISIFLMHSLPLFFVCITHLKTEMLQKCPKNQKSFSFSPHIRYLPLYHTLSFSLQQVYKADLLSKIGIIIPVCRQYKVIP